MAEGKFIEPVVIQGINKDVAPDGLDYSGRKILNPVRDVLNGRYLSSEGGEIGQVENIRGTIPTTLSGVYKQLVTNPNFQGGITGWTQQDMPGGASSWTYSSNEIFASNAGAISSSDIIKQPISVIPGTTAAINVAARIASGTLSGTIYGFFLDSSNNIISSFVILSLNTFLPGFNSRDVTINVTVPLGTTQFGICAQYPVSPAYSIAVRTCSISGYQTIGEPDGVNECIGTYENIEKNILIFFLWNSNGYHGVFRYDVLTDQFTQILADTPSAPVLKFSNNPRYAITGVGMIGDILTWTDNLNPQRYVNITRQYNTINDFTVSLYKIAPRRKPVDGPKTAISPARNVNNIADNNYQLAYRYVYLDNETSALSPYSDLIIAEAYGEDRAFLNIRNKVDITFYIDSDVSPFIKRVELLFRVGNSASWKVYKKYESFGSTIVDSFTNDYIGESVPDSESSKIFDSIPVKSKALAVVKNRIILNINEEGIEVPAITITASRTGDIDTSNVPVVESSGFLKKDGMYSVGVVVGDMFGRMTGVYRKAQITGRGYVMDEAQVIFNPPPEPNNIIGDRLNINLSGKVPTRSRYSIVVSPELKYESYLQTWAQWYLYHRDDVDSNPAVPARGEFLYRSYIWSRGSTGSTPGNTSFPYMHWALPLDLPFVPDTSYSIRILNGPGTRYSTEKILEVRPGNILVTGKFDLPNYEDRYFFIEIFKLKKTAETFYYEVAGPFDSVDGSPSVSSITGIRGDTYYRGAYGRSLAANDNSDVNFRATRFNSDLIGAVGGFPPFLAFNIPTQAETPSPIYTGGSGPTNVIIRDNVFVSLGSTYKGYALDYSKIAWGRGRPFVEVQPTVLHRPCTLRFSDLYVEDSKINGLNSFPVENIYDKIGQDRSPIVKLLQVGNVLLAIHERSITTIYVGEGIVKTGTTGFLAKTDDYIGDDRKLIGDYGSYHPESVRETEGQAFGYDIFSGCVWRYTVEGIIAVSDFGMKNYFSDRSNAYLPFKDTLKFVSVIDSYNKEYMLTLPHKYSPIDPFRPVVPFNPSSGSFDKVLDPDLYTVGETYRVRIALWQQSDVGNPDPVNISLFRDGITPVIEDVSYTVRTYVELDASVIYLEWVYNGEGFLRTTITGINEAIYGRISFEYREIVGETWVFNYEKKVWSHRYSFVPEFMEKVGDKVFSFNKGRLWQHNASDTHNNFYNIQYEQEIRIAVNPRPNEVKVWSALQIARKALTLDDSSSYKVMECSNADGQESYTRVKEFEKKEGVFYGPILKDVNTNPALIPAGRIALRDGKDMRAKSLEVTIRNNRTDRALLQKINLVGEKSEFSI